MRIIINDLNEIIGYVLTGELTGSVEFDGHIPDDFTETFKPTLYVLQSGSIARNANYTPPVALIANTPDAQDEINALLLKEVAALHTQLGGHQ